MKISIWRGITVWLVTTGTAAVIVWWALTAPVPSAALDADLTRGAALLLAGCAAWAWIVTTLVLGESVGAGSAPGVPLWARRVVLAACGLALVGAGAPAMATTPDAPAPTAPDPSALIGLRLPDRTTGPAHDPTSAPTPVWFAARATAAPLAVRPGDSLWRLAAARLPAGASAVEVDALSDRLYTLNRGVIGDDPDLITPGQLLRLPAGPRTDR